MESTNPTSDTLFTSQEIDLNEVANMETAEEQIAELRSKVELDMGVIGGMPNQPVQGLLQVSRASPQAQRAGASHAGGHRCCTPTQQHRRPNPSLTTPPHARTYPQSVVDELADLKAAP